jgi:hypothetical protein
MLRRMIGYLKLNITLERKKKFNGKVQVIHHRSKRRAI